MLILTRKIGESFLIGDDIEIILTELNKGSARIGIKAPRSFPIYRKEIYEKILKENKKASNAMLDNKSFNSLNDLLSKQLGG